MKTVDTSGGSEPYKIPIFGDIQQGQAFYHDGSLCIRAHPETQSGNNYVNLDNGCRGSLNCNHKIRSVNAEIFYRIIGQTQPPKDNEQRSGTDEKN